MADFGEQGPAPSWLTPYKFRPPAEIPPRGWLYGGHYIKGYLTATFAASGMGKSSLQMVETLAMATGKPLLGIKPVKRLRVGYWNGEDPLEETERRFSAAIMRYGLDGCELERDGWLTVGSGREHGLKFATLDHSGIVVGQLDVEKVEATIRARRLDVLIIDPLVRTHGVGENDNIAMDTVCDQVRMIAERCNVAFEAAHHTRKVGAGSEVTVDDGRGASAIVAAARSVRVLNPMSKDEADKAGVDRARSYFRVENGKASMAPPPDKATWFRFESVNLGNGNALYPEGDSVGVVTPWAWPDPFDNVGATDAACVQAAVDVGNWRENAQARDWVGFAVAEALGLDLGPSGKDHQRPAHKQARAKVKGLLKTWLEKGVLSIETRPDKHREDRLFVVVGKRIVP